jgi:hypothetical protein
MKALVPFEVIVRKIHLILSLKSQIATIKGGRGHHRKYLPYAYIEQGLAIDRAVDDAALAKEKKDRI